MASGVDGSVRRVETAYDGQGNPYLITSYDATTGGSVVNQIQRAYNGLGQMTQEWQATNGAVNTSTTPSVQYGYSFAPSGSTNHSRLTSITYPNGRVLTYNYATGVADNISRLSSITDGATTLESYDYLGLGTVVRRAHSQTSVDQTYIKLTGESDGSAGDKYIGLDAFGRLVDQRWTTSGGTTADRFGYAYDRDSNRLYKENLVSASNSELYSYDNLNQLSSFQRGTLNGTKTGLTGSASRSQSWDFDALGNFDSQTTDGTTQTRTANKQNEITSISGATTPTYDSNGNLTKDETGRTFTYDAWNRLATVKDSGGTLLATYKWDGLGHRVREVRGSTTTDLYYSDQWQVLEERVGGVAKFSYVWSPVYVDAMIARDRDTDANGSLDERLYAVNDANFNVTALINTTGTVVERYQYDPFGKFGVLDGSWASRGSSSYAWNYLHQGGRWDSDGGLYSFRNREFSPTLGRWLQTDPIGFYAGDSNLYAYVGGNPIGFIDPMGKQKKGEKDFIAEATIIMSSNAKNKGALIARLIDRLSCPLREEEVNFIKIVADGKLNSTFSDGQIADGQIDNIRIPSVRNAVTTARDKLQKCVKENWKPSAEEPNWCAIFVKLQRGISGLNDNRYFVRNASLGDLSAYLHGAITDGNRKLFCQIYSFMKTISNGRSGEVNQALRSIIDNPYFVTFAEYSCS